MKKIENKNYRIFYPYIFTSRDRERFNCEFFNRHGYVDIIYDLSSLIDPEIGSKIEGSDRKKDECVVEIINHEQLEEIFQSIQPEDINAVFVPLTSKMSFFYELLTKYNVKYIVFNLAPLPTVRSRFSFKNQSCLMDVILLSLRSFKLLYLFIYRVLLLEMKIKYWRLKAPAYWVTGAKGRISNSIYFPKFWKAKEIKCHSLDFEKILSEESDYPKEIVSNKNYAVFLDEFYPFHPDYYYSNLECPVTPDKYFESICKFFDVVEKEFGLRVVIAAHPRSDYDQRLEDYFAGRQIIKGETLGLVKEANLIVAHSSTSLSYAVFYKKPVVLITTDQIEQKLFFRLGISQMANALGCCKINCNRFSMNKSKVLSINKKKYDFYLKEYVSWDESSRISLWKKLLQQLP